MNICLYINGLFDDRQTDFFIKIGYIAVVSVKGGAVDAAFFNQFADGNIFIGLVLLGLKKGVRHTVCDRI